MSYSESGGCDGKEPYNGGLIEKILRDAKARREVNVYIPLDSRYSRLLGKLNLSGLQNLREESQSLLSPVPEDPRLTRRMPEIGRKLKMIL